jgi:uncharacterized protein involved in propanediol utilization
MSQPCTALPARAVAAGRPGAVRPRTRIGVGHAPAHHGEILQGVFRDRSGRLHRGLVTLPMSGLGSVARFQPDGTGVITVRPAGLEKSRRAAELTAARLYGRQVGGTLSLERNIPVGIGMGSSTSDVVATCRAVADSGMTRLSDRAIAEIAVVAECASDPVMLHDQVTLFAQREGVALERLGTRLSRVTVVGCDTDPTGRGVDTLRQPPARYDQDEIATFAVLLAALRYSVQWDDVALLGRVATASSTINQRYLRSAGFDQLLAVCELTGGVGVQVAHSGTVAGILFDPQDHGVREKVGRCERLLARHGLTHTTTFSTGVLRASETGES